MRLVCHTCDHSRDQTRVRANRELDRLWIDNPLLSGRDDSVLVTALRSQCGKVNPAMTLSKTIAYFITPHGFGHATRACAVMAAVQRINPTVRFEIFTRVPRWLFDHSLDLSFGYHEVLTDIGLAQHNALHEDIDETVRRLDAFFPFRSALIDPLAQQVTALGCCMVVCDVAALGMTVARAAGIPSILVENFTWDWIYTGYASDNLGLIPHIVTLQHAYTCATYTVQTEPVCQYRHSNLVTEPVSRVPRQPRDTVRTQLGIPQVAPCVLITMGGLSAADQHGFLDQLHAHREAWFIIPGSHASLNVANNVVRLPHQSAFYHPDLLHAADAVVGKTGYSTVAETYHAGLPYGYVSRPKFRESDVMEAYIQTHMRGIGFSEIEFHSGAWLDRLPELLAHGKIQRTGPNGADQIADFLMGSVL